MAYEIVHRAFTPLAADAVAAWRGISPSIASDCLNRRFAMSSAIRPLAPGMALCGQARTVSVMAGDNSMLHIALQYLRPGEILVVDASGITDVAVWGEVLTTAALARRVGGLVIDGATRDSVAVRQSGLPVFCAGVVPRGPHKGFGGTMDDVISAGGVSVAPGDLVLADDDGVVVVPLDMVAQALAECEARIQDERRWMEQIREGESTASLLGLPSPVFRQK